MPVLDSETDISVPPRDWPSISVARPPTAGRSRNTTGPLGYGWTDNWEYSLAVDSSGTVTVTMPSGQERIFQPDTRYADQYFSEPGDDGVLTQVTRRRLFTTGGQRRQRVLQRQRHTTLHSGRERQPHHGGIFRWQPHQPHVVFGRFAHDRLQLGRFDQLGVRLQRPERDLFLRLYQQVSGLGDGNGRGCHSVHLRQRYLFAHAECPDRHCLSQRHTYEFFTYDSTGRLASCRRRAASASCSSAIRGRSPRD